MERKAPQAFRKNAKRKVSDITYGRRKDAIEEMEFIMEMERLKRGHKKKPLTSAEILEAARKMGYRKVAEPRPVRKVIKRDEETDE